MRVVATMGLKRGWRQVKADILNCDSIGSMFLVTDNSAYDWSTPVLLVVTCRLVHYS